MGVEEVRDKLKMHTASGKSGFVVFQPNHTAYILQLHAFLLKADEDANDFDDGDFGIDGRSIRRRVTGSRKRRRGLTFYMGCEWTEEEQEDAFDVKVIVRKVVADGRTAYANLGIQGSRRRRPLPHRLERLPIRHGDVRARDHRPRDTCRGARSYLSLVRSPLARDTRPLSERVGWATGGTYPGADTPCRTVRACARERRVCDSCVASGESHALARVPLLLCGGWLATPLLLPSQGLHCACDPRLASQPNRPAQPLPVSPGDGGWVREWHPAASLATPWCAVAKSEAPWSRGRLLPTYR
eukprot:6214827-Pleurochrysis_carterae.AAC.5